MPKGKKHTGGATTKKKERLIKAAIKRERKAGGYLSPSDPDFKSFSNQLAVQGLKLRDVPGDGNCLFRALSLQLDNRLLDHRSIRRDVVQYMRQHRMEFEPFLEDEISFDQYVTELAKDAEYAGNDVIVAFARCYGCHVVIHQHNTPRLEVRGAGEKGTTLHIAYLNEEHYCSVEPILTTESLPQIESVPRPLQVAAMPKPQILSADQMPFLDSVEGVTSDEVLAVARATGCEDLVLVEQSLCENSYDPELAIVELLQLMSLSVSAVSEPAAVAYSNGHRKSDWPQALRENRCEGQVQSKKSQQPQRGHHISNRERKERTKASRNQHKKGSERPDHKPQDPTWRMCEV